MNRMVVVDLSVRLTFHVVVVTSIYLTFAGHNQPGGGFVGGLLMGSAIAMRYAAGGMEEVRGISRVQPWTILGAGLVLAATAAGLPLLLGDQVLEAAKLELDLPVFGDYGLPRHERGVVESQPGLYFMGLMLLPSVPSLVIDLCGAVLTTTYTNFGHERDYVFCIQTDGEENASGADTTGARHDLMPDGRAVLDEWRSRIADKMNTLPDHWTSAIMVPNSLARRWTRSSRSMRPTCARRTSGRCRSPAAARARSSASGILAQRK